MRWKRTKECQTCRKKINADYFSTEKGKKSNAKALNAGNKIWSVYKIEMDGHVYYGQTGITLQARASAHKTMARRGVHKSSYIHQQIMVRDMSGPEVAGLMKVLMIASNESESKQLENRLIDEALVLGVKICNSKGIK